MIKNDYFRIVPLARMTAVLAVKQICAFPCRVRGFLLTLIAVERNSFPHITLLFYPVRDGSPRTTELSLNGYQLKYARFMQANNSTI